MTRRIAILPFLFVIALPLFAQKTSGTLAGLVIGDVKVELLRGKVLVAQTTAHDGRFRIEAPAGKYQLRINGVVSRDIVIRPGIVTGISDERLDAESPLVATTFDTEQLEQLPMSRLVGDATRLATGATRTDVFGEPYGPSYLDGVVLLQEAAWLPPEFVESIVVRNAAYPAEYGRATDSSVDVVMRNAVAPFNASAFAFVSGWHHDAAERDAGFTVGGPVVRDRLFVFVGYDNLRNDYDYFGKRVHAEANTVLAKAAFIASPHANVTATTIGTPTIRWGAVSASFASGDTTGELTASHFNTFLPSRDAALVRAGITHAFGNHVVRTGGEAVRGETVGYTPFNGVTAPHLILGKQTHPAFWLADTWYAGHSIVVNAGVRRQSTFGDSGWEPRVAVMWRADDGSVQTALSYGRHSIGYQAGLIGSHERLIADETVAELSLPRPGVTMRFIHRDADATVYGSFSPFARSATTRYNAAEVEWSHRTPRSWVRASWVHANRFAPYLGSDNTDDVKLLATANVAKFELGGTATYESGVPDITDGPLAVATTRVDLHAAYPILPSLSLIGDALNVFDDDANLNTRRSLRAGVRWRR
jgi:hypothetical protein